LAASRRPTLTSVVTSLRRRVTALLVTAALLASCSQSGSQATAPTSTARDGTSTSPGTADRDPATTAPSTGTEQPLAEWEPCGSGFDCATIAVPLDHDQPDGPTIDLALQRLPAGDADRRIGSVLVNPGGPGASGLSMASSLVLLGSVMDRFDIVGFDPRGVGHSTALTCNTHVQAIYDADPTMDDQADIDHFRTVSEQFVDECASEHADLLPHLGTVAVAHDLDRIRAAVGDEQLTYLGYSYGTSIGQQYARLYPTRVRAMVLDGVVDPSESGLVAAEGQAEGFTNALDAYAADCDADRCLGDPALTVVDRVTAASEAAPIPAAGADRPATPGVVSLAVAYALYAELLWPQLTRALRDADAGNATGLVRLADSYLSREPDGSYGNSAEVYFAVSCLDADWPRSFDEVPAAGAAAGDRYPRFGEALVNDYARCALWPVPPQPLEPVPTDLEGLAPIVVVSTTGDPATPYESGVRIAEQIPDARLVTNVGDTHTVVGQGRSCIDDLVTDYFVDLVVPEDGVRCG
jgi:pimeloyl-ACP methyl ester carboxylesterase